MSNRLDSPPWARDKRGVQEFLATLSATVDALAAADPACAQFGAAMHRYRRAAPIEPARWAAINSMAGGDLPPTLQALVCEFGDGGVGPYYGLVPLDHPLQLQRLAGQFDPDARAPGWQGAAGLCHLGCDYAAVMPVRGPHVGEVWLDLRAAQQGWVRAAGSLFEFIAAWTARAAQGRLPAPWVRQARCALPAALSGYFQTVEVDLGIAEGSLAGDALAAAIARIPAGGIAIASSGTLPWFALGEHVAPCVTCVQLIEQLSDAGLTAAHVAPGLNVIPSRNR